MTHLRYPLVPFLFALLLVGLSYSQAKHNRGCQGPSGNHTRSQESLEKPRKSSQLTELLEDQKRFSDDMLADNKTDVVKDWIKSSKPKMRKKPPRDSQEKS